MFPVRAGSSSHASPWTISPAVAPSKPGSASGASRPRPPGSASSPTRRRIAVSPALTATMRRDGPAPRSMATAWPSAPAIRSGASRRAGSADRSRRSARTEFAQPRFPARLVPRESGAALRIVAAGQADLVAVVDARGTGHRHLEQRRQPDALRVAAEQAAQPRRVVRTEQVELDGDDVGVVGRGQVGDLPGEGWAVERTDGDRELPVRRDQRGVEPVARREADDRLGQRVVHQRVEAVAAEPVRGHPPDLADEVGVGTDRPTAPAELLPERLVVDLAGNVQPPAVDPEAEPVLGDAEQVLADLAARRC